MAPPSPPVALTIAGTDSGAGAGVGADLRSFAAQGVHGVFAVTVVTAQNTIEVRSAHPLPQEMLAAQIDAVTDDFDVAASKTGLLWGLDAVHTVAERLGSIGTLVVDPVLVNSKRMRIQPVEVDDAYRRLLFPGATVITPNVAEAQLLAEVDIIDVDTARNAAAALRAQGPEHVVITGLLAQDEALDVWAAEDGVEVMAEPMVDTRNIHGTGCSFAATVAARLALGDSPDVAIPFAKGAVAAAIQRAAHWTLGSGQGPIDQLGRS